MIAIGYHFFYLKLARVYAENLDQRYDSFFQTPIIVHFCVFLTIFMTEISKHNLTYMTLP